MVWEVVRLRSPQVSFSHEADCRAEGSVDRSMTFSKYTIHHLDLFNEVHPLRDAGHYCVFWYQSIPLGEAYIDFRDQATPLQFWEGCIRAISPALKDLASGNEESCRLIQSMHPDLFSILFTIRFNMFMI